MNRISELIAKLEVIKAEHGDSPMLIKEDGFGGYAIHTFGSCDIEERYAGNKFEVNLKEKEIKEIIPEYDGTTESLDKDFNCVVFSRGTMIYST